MHVRGIFVSTHILQIATGMSLSKLHIKLFGNGCKQNGSDPRRHLEGHDVIPLPLPSSPSLPITRGRCHVELIPKHAKTYRHCISSNQTPPQNIQTAVMSATRVTAMRAALRPSARRVQVSAPRRLQSTYNPTHGTERGGHSTGSPVGNKSTTKESYGPDGSRSTASNKSLA